MKKLRWQLLVVILALAAIAILLLSQQPTLLPGIVPQIQPVSGGVYTEALVGSLGRLNPVLDSYNQPDQDVDRLVFSSLIRFDDRGLPQGDLAETWGISQDGTSYSFSIRPNAKWHDGQPVTADDILFTVDFLRADQAPVMADLRNFWKQVEVVVLDERTIQFRLPEAFAPFMEFLTFGVLPKHLLGNVSVEQLVNEPFNLKPVGSGPYRFDHLVIKDGQITGVTLAVNKDYYGKVPFIEQVVFKYYPDSQAALTAYRQGDVLGIDQVTQAILLEALKEPDLGLYTGRMPRMSLVYLNLDDPQLSFLKDAVVRRALLLGLNRQRIIDRLLGGQALLADAPILPNTWAYFDGVERLSYDPETAIATLKKAGYTIPASGGEVRSKDNVRLELELLYPEQPPYPEIAQAIQEDWAKIGVKVTLQAVPFDKLVSDHLELHNYQAALADLNLDNAPDPDPYPFWHQAQINGGQNYAQWDDRQASEYLEQARVNDDYAERARRYRNFQVRFTHEMPSLPLFFPVYTYGVDRQVQGVRMGPLYDPSDRFASINEWFLMARRGGLKAEK